MTGEQKSRLKPQVVVLAFAALCNDMASEMIYPLLPLFITTYLGGTAFVAGTIEGVADALSACLKYYAGRLSDRMGRRKPLVIAGYGLPTISRVVIALATTWPMIFAARLLDRTGKGIRSAPRDAIIADVTPGENRGRAFGFHRALDHTGALIGPLIAAALLSIFALELRTVFMLAIIPAVIGMILLLFALREPDRQLQPKQKEGEGDDEPLPGSFKGSLIPIALFSLANSSDVFLLLQATRAGVAAAMLPLLWSTHHILKATLSERAGALSDRIDRRWLLGIGWIIYAVTYFFFSRAMSLTAMFVLFGLYALPFALTEGAERAWVIRHIGSGSRGRAFGAYYLTTGIFTLAGTLLFGAIYESVSPTAAFLTGGSIAIVAALSLLPQKK